jgi:hypothetical protein
MSLDEEYIYLNGPVNFFRLSNGDKEIYLFGDKHVSVEWQTECDELDSVNFDKYLKYFFKKNKKKVDFMLEIEQKPKTAFNKKYNYKYIYKIRKVFQDLYNINPHHEYLKVHYIDVRLFNNIDEPNLFAYDIIDFVNTTKLSDFDYIIKTCSTIVILLTEQLNIINKYLSDENTKVDKENIVDVIMRKIILEYNDPENKKNINKFLHDMVYKKIQYIITSVNDFIEKCKKYQEIFDKYYDDEKFEDIHVNSNKELHEQYLKHNYFSDSDEYKKIKDSVVEFTADLNIHTLYLGAYIMDMYFLRRFLDKQYIKNAIVYTGLSHTANILHFLVKSCDYKIIEFGFIDNKMNASELEKLIKKTNSYMDIYKYINNDKQCIKIKQFFE